MERVRRSSRVGVHARVSKAKERGAREGVRDVREVQQLVGQGEKLSDEGEEQGREEVKGKRERGRVVDLHYAQVERVGRAKEVRRRRREGVRAKRDAHDEVWWAVAEL